MSGRWISRPAAWARRALQVVPIPAAAAENWRNRFRAWMAQRTPRERVILLAGAVTLTSAIFIVAIWRPLNEARAEALGRIAVLDRVIAQARTIDPTDTGAVPLAAASPATVIADSAGPFGLTIRRLESEGLQTEVTLDDAKFETLLMWLEALGESDGLHATRVELERRPEPGVVAARLTLER